ncbi:hypothetical protein JCM2811A_27160 [Methylorubrum rhodinum]
MLRASHWLWPFLTHCFADQTYQGKHVGKATTLTVEIIHPDKRRKGIPCEMFAHGGDGRPL